MKTFLQIDANITIFNKKNSNLKNGTLYLALYATLLVCVHYSIKGSDFSVFLFIFTRIF